MSQYKNDPRMYVDKIMNGHNQMQAIASVNRFFEDKANGLAVDFIGIAGFLADATKKYTSVGGEGKLTINRDAAFELCLKQFAAAKSLLGKFDLEVVNKMTAINKLKWSNGLVNSLLQTDAVTDVFLHEECKMTKLVAMTNSDPRIWVIREEVGIIHRMRDVIRKIKSPRGPQRKKNDRIKDLISKSIESREIIDGTAMYDLDMIDISIIDDRFQAIAKEKGSENTKVELLHRIIDDELKVRMVKKFKHMTSLKDELETVLSRYHKNCPDSIAAIKHQFDIADEFKNDDIRTKQVGLTEYEPAFYDLLSANEKLLNEAGPIQDLVHKVVASVKKNLQLDWSKKKDARAANRLVVKI